jgi:hypothetical protein
MFSALVQLSCRLLTLIVVDKEAITVEISKPKSKPFLINAWYRPPDTPFEKFENFEDCLLENGRGK